MRQAICIWHYERTAEGSILEGRRKALGLACMHPVNAGLRAGDHRERHTTVCGGNLENRERWVSRRRKQNYLLTTSYHCSCYTLRSHNRPHFALLEIACTSSSVIENVIGVSREQTKSLSGPVVTILSSRSIRRPCHTPVFFPKPNAR